MFDQWLPKKNGVSYPWVIEKYIFTSIFSLYRFTYIWLRYTNIILDLSSILLLLYDLVCGYLQYQPIINRNHILSSICISFFNS